MRVKKKKKSLVACARKSISTSQNCDQIAERGRASLTDRFGVDFSKTRGVTALPGWVMRVRSLRADNMTGWVGGEPQVSHLV